VLLQEGQGSSVHNKALSCANQITGLLFNRKALSYHGKGVRKGKPQRIVSFGACKLPVGFGSLRVIQLR